MSDGRRQRKAWFSERVSPLRSTMAEEEADSEDPEDLPNLNALLLPSGSFPLDVERFSVSYSKALLAGWVKQGSPCCAAASVAGAWNALGNQGRREAGALSSEMVLGTMRAVLEEQIASMIARLERILGASIGPLLTSLKAELELEGKHLGGTKANKSTVARGPHLLRLIRSITTRERQQQQQQQQQQHVLSAPPGSDNVRAGEEGAQAGASTGVIATLGTMRDTPIHSVTVFDKLWELYENERMEAMRTTAMATAADAISAGFSTAAHSAHQVGEQTDGNGEQTGVQGLFGSKASFHALSSVAAERNFAQVISDDGGGRQGEIRPRMHSSARGSGEVSCAEGVVPWRPGIAWAVITSGRSYDRLEGEVGGDNEAGTSEEAGNGLGRHCWGDEQCPRKEAGGDNLADAEDPDGEKVENDEDEEDEEIEEEEEGDHGTIEERVDIDPPSAHQCHRSTGRRGQSHRGKRKSKRGPINAGRGGGERTARQICNTEWRWKKDLCQLLKRMGGLEKLCSSRPSTGAFGNWGVISTIQRLDSEQTDPDSMQVTASLFMGKQCQPRFSRLPVPLSARDTEEDKVKQWNALKAAFVQNGQVLIFHLSNHYALIFALREWHCPAATTASPTRSTSPTTSSTLLPTTTTTAATTTTMAEVSDTRDGASTTRNDGFTLEGARDRNVISCDSRVGWTRQLLTAKRGQRPSTWIDFDDARRTMLGWQGYKIIAVQRGKAASTPL